MKFFYTSSAMFIRFSGLMAFAAIAIGSLEVRPVVAQESLARRAISYATWDYTQYDFDTPISDSGTDFSDLVEDGPLSANLEGGKPALVDTSSLVTSFDFDTSTAKIRSSMNMKLRLDGSDGSDLGWGEYTLEGRTEAIVQDVINVNDSGFGFMEISIGYDGTVTQQLDLDPNQASSAGIETHSQIYSNLSWQPDAVADLFFADGDFISSNDVVNEEIEGFTPKSKTKTENIDARSEPAIIPLLGDPASFTISVGWQEIARTRIYSVDAEYAESEIDHDFLSTANLMLQFYDQDMNPIEPLSYTSALGINYQTATVPEPASAMAPLAIGLFCLGRRRRLECPYGVR